ncbi:hypothetical protein COT42_00985 [Candidatus Saganbacteria bacterium CG08_land_8_20_14_0_20_45_16]|uniref:General secretion pathway GspH domain-containing protein n=1 Tax=Candidatus Saganbacteria bacterium CG08_land_8_20_14_0_20_45_16 TaxID=2014293 RepID=A0A2H0Y1G1_UNCSA|nr:MAG: hypothetical protein COT42_00985 [Candidatus Saganbacteria bacterium CG08_land_8_20_14_0_20_45_16]
MKLKGFTLLELLVTVACVGLLFSLSLPSLVSLAGQLTLNNQARVISSNLRVLQAEAETQHTRLTFALPSLPNGVNLIKPANFSFAASGFPVPGGSGTLIIGNKFGQQRKIILSSAGRVRLE